MSHLSFELSGEVSVLSHMSPMSNRLSREILVLNACVAHKLLTLLDVLKVLIACVAHGL